MKNTVMNNRYQILFKWYDKNSNEYAQVKLVYDFSIDYLSMAQTSEDRKVRLVECAKGQIRLEDRIGNELPIMEILK